MDTTQQFVLSDDTVIDPSRNVKTDFYETVMYLHLFKKTQSTGGYIELPYFMPSGIIRENVTYITPSATTKYKCKNMYIFRATHNVVIDDTYAGEMVIELEPVTGNSNTLYVCFLLKNTRFSNNESSSIDKIIQMSKTPPINYTSMNFKLQSYFENNQKKIIYPSGVDTVIVYTTPISINEVDFSTFSQIPTSLFAIYPTDAIYRILYNTPAQEGFQEGMDKVMTCTPINMSDPNGSTKGKYTASYLMDNKVAQQEKHLGVVYSMTIFIVLLFCAYFGGPPIYKMLIIDYNKKSEDLILSTIFFLLFVLLLGFILLLNGAIYDPIESIVGMMILLFTSLSMVSVFNQRVSDDDYRKPAGSGSAVDINFSAFSENAGTAITEFIKNMGDNILGKYLLPNDKNLGIGVYWLMLLIILVIPCAVIGAKKDKASNKKERRKRGYRNNLIGLIMGIGGIYGLFALIWMFSLAYSSP